MEAGAKEKTKGDNSKVQKKDKKYAPYWFENGKLLNLWTAIQKINKLLIFLDLGSNNSGYYTLQAVLTHKGRSSSSGHYVGWVRIGGDKWVKCDDDTVTPVTEEEILKLSGGGKIFLRCCTKKRN